MHELTQKKNYLLHQFHKKNHEKSRRRFKNPGEAFTEFAMQDPMDLLGNQGGLGDCPTGSRGSYRAWLVIPERSTSQRVRNGVVGSVGRVINTMTYNDLQTLINYKKVRIKSPSIIKNTKHVAPKPPLKPHRAQQGLLHSRNDPDPPVQHGDRLLQHALQPYWFHLAPTHPIVTALWFYFQVLHASPGQSTYVSIIEIGFVLLCVVPFANVVPLLFAAVFAYVYWASLKIYELNLAKIKDPFRKMTFNPEVCFNMGCDYYFFTIELKCT